ncbi:MAG: hypothetical protein HYY93_07020 [Planctomycetes bacterium]|nr:hypothetical protein [Planctomycetota bacterium]
MANDPALMTAAIDYARAQSDGEYETLQNELHVKQAEVARMEKEERNLVQFVRSTGGEAKGGVTPVSIAEELRTLRDQLTAVREQVAGLTVRLKEARRKVVDPEAVRDCLRFFDTVYEMLSPAEKGTLIASFVQKVVYTTELLQIFLYNEPFDRETMAQAEKALRDAPVAAGGATGLSSSNEWWALQDLNL